MSDPGAQSARRAQTRGERIRADLILLAAALIWGSGFVGGRVAGDHLNAYTYNGARFLLGALTVLPFAGLRMRRLAGQELWGGMAAGVLLVAASNLQQLGLQHTTAGKAGFITGLYVVLVPLFAAIVLRRNPAWSAWAASIVAATGLYLLSGVRGLTLAPGDTWVLAGAAFWALHILIIGRLASTADPLRLSVVQFSTCGLLSIVLGFVVGPNPLAGWRVAWWAAVYNGLLSAGLAMTLQTYAQQHTPAPDTAVILSLEAVFAALFGWTVLGESLSPTQVFGCGLMLAGMLLAQAPAIRRARAGKLAPSGDSARR